MSPTTHAIAALTTTPQPTHCSRARSIARRVAAPHDERRDRAGARAPIDSATSRRELIVASDRQRRRRTAAPTMTTATRNVRVVRRRRPVSAPVGNVVASTANASGTAPTSRSVTSAAPAAAVASASQRHRGSMRRRSATTVVVIVHAPTIASAAYAGASPRSCAPDDAGDERAERNADRDRRSRPTRTRASVRGHRARRFGG